MQFRWNEWNVEHIAKHGIMPTEAEYVVENNSARYDRDGKYLAKGQTSAGRYIQVIFIFSPADVVFVIHARPLNDGEKRKYRKRRRGG